VFAKGELDAATKLLLESLDSEESPKNILDFACGGGVIGAELSARWPKAELSGLDADAIALHVAALNAPYSKLYLSDSWSSLQSQTYDLIVSNPPIHRGKSEDHQALDSLIVHARAYLNPGGRLWLVGQRRLGLGRRLQGSLKGQCVKDDGRFQVWSAQ